MGIFRSISSLPSSQYLFSSVFSFVTSIFSSNLRSSHPSHGINTQTLSCRILLDPYIIIGTKHPSAQQIILQYLNSTFEKLLVTNQFRGLWGKFISMCHSSVLSMPTTASSVRLARTQGSAWGLGKITAGEDEVGGIGATQIMPEA
jgi:hypothetical protein